MITFSVIGYYGISLNGSVLVQNYRMLRLEIGNIVFSIITLHQFHCLPIGILEVEHMFALTDNRVLHHRTALNDERIGNNHEMSWHTGGVRIIDTIPFHPESRFLINSVYPDALQ